MRRTSLIDHLISILILPGTVVGLIPYLLYTYLSDLVIYDDHFLLKASGIIFIILGSVVFIRSVFIFDKMGKGTLAPWKPPSKLVIDGLYKYVRNPMISGVICLLTGEALFLNSIPISIWAMVFFVINTVYFEFIEEPRLERRFGEDYVRYKKQVPRWIPKTKPYNNTSNQ